MKDLIKKFIFTLEKWSNSSYAPWIIFVAALTTRFIGAYFGGVRADDEDGIYGLMAREFLAGNGFSFMKYGYRNFSWLPPGMSFIYLPFVYFFKNPETPLRVFFIFMSAFTNVVLFQTAKRVLDQKWAFLSALIWIFYVPQWFWGSRVNPHTYSTNILVICIWVLFLAWERKALLLGFLTGFLWLTSSLTRGEYVFGFTVMMLTSFLFFKEKKWGVKMALIIFLGWIAGFLPWALRNYHHHHKFVLIATNDGDNLWKANNADYHFGGDDIPYPPELLERLKAEPNEAERSNILKREAVAYLKAHPEKMVQNIAGNLLHFWRPWIFSRKSPLFHNLLYLVCYVPLFVFFLVGLFYMDWKNSFWLTIVGMIVYKWFIHVPFYIIVRFRENIMPLMAILAAFGFSIMIEKFMNKRTSDHG